MINRKLLESSTRSTILGKPTVHQLRWNQFRKQFLLDDKISNYLDVVKFQLGLHSTDYWTPYFSTWARIGDFDAKAMYESLDSGRKLVRTHAFRTTIHVMHIDNLSMIISATGPSLFRAYRSDKYRKVDILTDEAIEKMLGKVKDALQQEPLRTSDLKKKVPELGEHIRSALLMLMARGEVVRARAPHARSNLTSYALLENWVDNFKLEIMDEEQAVTDLINHHIELFGPASIDDIAWWLRLTKTTVKTVVSNLDDSLVKLDFRTREGFMEKSDYEQASSVEPSKDDLVWFLPYEDHFLKAFIDRTDFIDESIRPKIFPADRKHYWPSNPDVPMVMPSKGIRATGEARPTIWLNGKVVGRWEIDDEGKQKKVVMNVYTKDARQNLERIEETRLALEEFVNKKLLPISS